MLVLIGALDENERHLALMSPFKLLPPRGPAGFRIDAVQREPRLAPPIIERGRPWRAMRGLQSAGRTLRDAFCNGIHDCLIGWIEIPGLHPDNVPKGPIAFTEEATVGTQVVGPRRLPMRRYQPSPPPSLAQIGRRDSTTKPSSPARRHHRHARNKPRSVS